MFIIASRVQIRIAKEFIQEATSIMKAEGFELGWEISGDSTDSETSLVLGVLWNKKKIQYLAVLKVNVIL